MNILIADDSPEVRRALAGQLDRISGVREVRHASDGVEAMEAMRVALPDLLILDLQMPRLNGFDVLDGIRERGYRLTTMVVSGHPEYREACTLRGATRFFEKGRDSDDLFSAVAALADGRVTP